MRFARDHNGVPDQLLTHMDAWYCGKEMARQLTLGNYRRARRLARQWTAGYERGFEADYGLPMGAKCDPDGHWRMHDFEPVAVPDTQDPDTGEHTT